MKNFKQFNVKKANYISMYFLNITNVLHTLASSRGHSIESL